MRTRTNATAAALFLGTVAALLLSSSCRSSFHDHGQELDAPPPVVAEQLSVVEETSEPSRVSMAFPTGDRSTSAILLEKEIPAEVVKDSPFEYLLVVENLTDRSLEKVRLTDTVPAGLSVESREPLAVVTGDVATWDLGTLGPRATKTVKVEAVAHSMEDFMTCATVEYESRLCAKVRVIAPSLEIDVNAPPEGLSSESFEVVFTVTNTGSGDAREVQVIEELPEGLTTLSGLSRFVMDFGTLSGGDEQSRSVRLRAEKGGAYTHNATVTAASGLTATAVPVTTVLREPRLALQITGDEDVRAGRAYAAQVVVLNAGDGDTVATSVDVHLPQGVTAMTYSDGGEETPKGLSWQLGALAPGDSRVLDMRLRAPETGVLVTEATVAGAGADGGSATLRTTVTGLAALGLSVSDEADLIPVGESVSYLIVVENEGTAEDKDVRVVAQVEEGITVVDAGGAASATIEGGEVRFDAIPSLAPGEKLELRVTVVSNVELDSRFQVSVTSETKTRPITSSESTDFFE